MKKLVSKLLALLMFLQMAPFSYAQLPSAPVPYIPPIAPIVEAPVFEIGSRCLTDSGTTPGQIQYYSCEDGACKDGATISCLSGYYCKQEGGNAICAPAAESTTEFVDDIDIDTITQPTPAPVKPVVTVPEPIPEVPEIEDELPEPEKTEVPEGIEPEGMPEIDVPPIELIGVVANEKTEIECPGCKADKELSDSFNKGVKRIIGFDPRKTKNGYEQASLAMTNNFAQNAGTTVALGLAYIPAVIGGAIADIVTGIPITIIKVAGGKAEYVDATRKIHNGFADGLKKAWKAIWG